MAQSDTASTMSEFLSEHPRLMGGLFTICLLLMEAGNVAANCCSTNSGP